MEGYQAMIRCMHVCMLACVCVFVCLCVLYVCVHARVFLFSVYSSTDIRT